MITGKTPSTSIAENYAWGTIPFYTPEDVAKGLGMMGRNSRFISKTGFEEIASNTISGESVLVGVLALIWEMLHIQISLVQRINK